MVCNAGYARGELHGLMLTRSEIWTEDALQSEAMKTDFNNQRSFVLGIVRVGVHGA